MKIVFSRKGVDSGAGRCASPLVDGHPVSLPIPTSMPTPIRYRDLASPASALAFDLSRGRLTPDRPCHLDPDIDRDALNAARPLGWRGAIGQVSASLSHLRNAGVGADDIFLFWGLFRACEKGSAGWRYVGPRHHAIFGWLQVDTIIDLGPDGSHALMKYPWLSQHPHVRAGWTKKNAIFLAKEFLTIGDGDVPGWGVFNTPFILTREGAATPSDWLVPAWLDPTCGGVGMTYNPLNRWLGNGRVTVAARGQEFVADARDRIDARRWVSSLFGR
jgi:Nucleotide modification associated domain 3